MAVNKTRTHTQRTWRTAVLTRPRISLAAFAAIGLIGVIALKAGGAATYISSVEAEGGVISGRAEVADAAGASGRAVRFSGAGTTPDPTGPTLTVGKGGQQYSTIQAAADAAKPGDTVLISGGTYNEQVIVRANGQPNKYITFQGKAGEQVVINGNKTITSGRNDTGLFEINARQYLRFINLTITQSPSTAIWGVNIGNITVQNVTVSNITHGGIVLINGPNVLIDGVDVSHTNDMGPSASHEAVSLTNIDNAEVKNSYVHDNGEEGIDFKYETRNGKIHGNRVINNRGPNIYADSVHDIQIYNNIAQGATGSDKGGIAVAVENYSQTRKAYGINIFNNIVTGNAGGGITYWVEGTGEITNTKVINNTIANNSRGAIVYATGAFGTGGNVIRNNILTGSVPSFWGNDPGAKFTISNNLTTGDPMFIDAAGGNYRLRVGSPAINKGVATDAPAVDYDGKVRPVGSAVDIGAYEQ